MGAISLRPSCSTKKAIAKEMPSGVIPRRIATFWEHSQRSLELARTMRHGDDGVRRPSTRPSRTAEVSAFSSPCRSNRFCHTLGFGEPGLPFGSVGYVKRDLPFWQVCCYVFLGPRPSGAGAHSLQRRSPEAGIRDLSRRKPSAIVVTIHSRPEQGGLDRLFGAGAPSTPTNDWEHTNGI